MESLWLLVPLSVLLVFGVVWVLRWAVLSGQFEEFERAGESIFDDDA